MIIKTFSSGEKCQISVKQYYLFIYLFWKCQFNVFFIYPLEVQTFLWMNKVADSVKKKLILSCRTNYITKRWCNSIGVAVRSGFNSGGSVAEQLGAPADL